MMKRWVLLTVLVALGGCKRAPKPFSAAGYGFTLHGGWDGELEHKKGFDHVVFSAFADDVACIAQVFPGITDPTGFFDGIVEEYHASDIAPATLQTPLGVFLGRKFVAHLSSDNPLVKVGLALGLPHGEIYALHDQDALVVLSLLTPGKPEDQAIAREHCAGILASIHREATPAK
ncbi:MAG: hypothetical protein JST54_24045 [Deltaproteobacteria bacterium]|nr:hypothetical protein [Deltaproteobacteria bacterium]